MATDVATVSSGASPSLIPIDYNSYRSTVSYDSRVRFLVMHYTAQNFKDSIQSLASEKSKVSAHYLVPDPTDPSYRDSGRTAVQIFSLVDESSRAWHAGVSVWADRTNLNDSSIGIEHVNLATSDSSGEIHFPPYNPEQLEATRQLAQNILQRYPNITPTRVVGHSDIAIGRKSDPGPCFPWKALHDSGIGAWYDEATKQKYTDLFKSQGVPPIWDVMQKFRAYGYDTSVGVGDPPLEFSQLVRAFQLHFRPGNYDGNLDVDTAATLYALVEKYFPDAAKGASWSPDA
ncbi:N-acetylmuramoyl-L-alanine amidase [Pandoraea pulmonicola]|nr:N-acetylmuramoyl-L-alanine amidase [Pandoraea pulmonicola]AJC23425.2 N-acetylmuramoyl-L-alanine amidase [Pandoraea pulmonicola]